MALGLIVGAVALALLVLPQIWVRRVIALHAVDRPDLPGTGGELARHLLDEMGLKSVNVEETGRGDHYDPDAKTVRLSRSHFTGRSLSAVVIAAHEVGHAMQDATGYPPLITRSRLARRAEIAQRIGAVVMLAGPVVMALVRSPVVLMADLFVGLSIMSLGLLIHAVTLPVELDASFGRALPVLEAGRFIAATDMPAARSILRAAAFTYVAAAALGLLDIARWLRLLRL